MLSESLWGDEGFSAMAVQRPFTEMIGVVMKDTAPPLFYVLGYLWGHVFGFGEVSLRSLSLLLMLGTGVFAGLTAYELSRNKRQSAAIGLMAFFSPFLFRFAFEWRMYALLSFTITGSTYFFIKKQWRGYIVMATAALYTHHFALFTIASQGIVYLLTEFKWREAKTYPKQLRAFLIIGGLYLFWLYPMYLQITRVQGSGFWLGVPTARDLSELISRFAAGGAEKAQRRGIWLLVLGLLVFKDWKRVGIKYWGLAAIVIGPVAWSFMASQVITPIFYDRYLLSVVAGMAILISLYSKKGAEIILWMIVVWYGALSMMMFKQPQKPPFREMAEYIKTEKGDGDVLINYNGRAHHLWESQYYGVPAPIYTPGGPLPLYVGTAQMKEDDTIDKLPTVKGRLGLIGSEPIETIVLPDYRLIESKQFGQLVFSWWKHE